MGALAWGTLDFKTAADDGRAFAHAHQARTDVALSRLDGRLEAPTIVEDHDHPGAGPAGDFDSDVRRHGVFLDVVERFLDYAKDDQLLVVAQLHRLWQGHAQIEAGVLAVFGDQAM